MASLPGIASNLTAGTAPATVVGNAHSNFWLYTPDQGFDLTHPTTPDGPAVYPQVTLRTSTMPVKITLNKTGLIVIDMQNIFLSPAL
jgi:hypothetical protein